MRTLHKRSSFLLLNLLTPIFGSSTPNPNLCPTATSILPRPLCPLPTPPCPVPDCIVLSMVPNPCDCPTALPTTTLYTPCPAVCKGDCSTQYTLTPACSPTSFTTRPTTFTRPTTKPTITKPTTKPTSKPTTQPTITKPTTKPTPTKPTTKHTSKHTTKPTTTSPTIHTLTIPTACQTITHTDGPGCPTFSCFTLPPKCTVTSTVVNPCGCTGIAEVTDCSWQCRTGCSVDYQKLYIPCPTSPPGGGYTTTRVVTTLSVPTY